MTQIEAVSSLEKGGEAELKTRVQPRKGARLLRPVLTNHQAPVPPPSYQRAQARAEKALHIDALTLAKSLHLLTSCRRAVRLAHQHCLSQHQSGYGIGFLQ